MPGEEIFIGPWMDIINSVIPVLEIIFTIAVCSLVLYLVWKKQPFKSWGARVLLKHRRGKDFTPELTDGRREKNKEKQEGYRLRNGDWVSAPLFKNLRPMGKKAYLELWEDESGRYISAPSPFETEMSKEVCPQCGQICNSSICPTHGNINPLNVKFLTGFKDNPDQFTQTDINWLIDQHKNDIRMFEKKNFLKEWLPIIVPAVTIIIVVLGLVLYQTQVLSPLTAQAQSIASSNAHSAEVWQNVTNAWSAQQACNQQAVVIPTGK